MVWTSARTSALIFWRKKIYQIKLIQHIVSVLLENQEYWWGTFSPWRDWQIFKGEGCIQWIARNRAEIWRTKRNQVDWNRWAGMEIKPRRVNQPVKQNNLRLLLMILLLPWTNFREECLPTPPYRNSTEFSLCFCLPVIFYFWWLPGQVPEAFLARFQKCFAIACFLRLTGNY